MMPAMTYPGLEHTIAYMLHVEHLTAELAAVAAGNKYRQATDLVHELKHQGMTHIEALSHTIGVFSA